MSSKKKRKLTKDQESEPIQYVTQQKGCAYPAEVGYAILDHLINGGSIRAIDSNPEWPSSTYVFWWMQGGVEGGAASVLAEHYARARTAQADRIGATVLDVIEDQTAALRGSKPEMAHANARVAMDSARWVLGRMKSHRWAEPTKHVEHSGQVTLQSLLDQAKDAKPAGLLDQARGRVIEGELADTVDKPVDN